MQLAELLESRPSQGAHIIDTRVAHREEDVANRLALGSPVAEDMWGLIDANQ